MTGLFITFEGTEGCGKSTQLSLLVDRLRAAGRKVRMLREPGGTPIGEEIRYALKHSRANAAMSAEAELLLMNASRAQLVREVIRPALDAGEIILCDRFYDSTTAYQGYGRQLNLTLVRDIIDLAVGDTKPDLTLFLRVSAETSAQRVRARKAAAPSERDRIEESGEDFFKRVAEGYEAIVVAEPERVRAIDADQPIEAVAEEIWRIVETILPLSGSKG